MLDYFLFHRLSSEISRQVTGKRVRKITQPDRSALALHFGNEEILLISIKPQDAVLSWESKVAEGINSPFLLRTKKYLKDHKVIKCEEARGQKILVISTHEVSLVVELPGIQNAMFLLDAEKHILAALPSQEEREIYQEPPLPSQHLFLASDSEIKKAWPDLYSGKDKQWWGLGKWHWEILRQYSEHKALALFLKIRKQSKTCPAYVVQGSREENLSLIPPLSQTGELLSEPIYRYYSQKLIRSTFEKQKYHYAELIEQALRKKQKKKTLQVKALQEAERSDDFKRFGDLILTYKHLTQEGQNGFINPDSGEEIVLDSKLDAAANAQQYYKRYKRGKAAINTLSDELKRLDRDIAELESLEALAREASVETQLNSLRHQLKQRNLLRSEDKKKLESEKEAFLRLEISPGWVAMAGRNADESAVLLRQANRDDLWFHVHGIPGGHVILHTENRPVPPVIIQKAAQLAAYYSQARGWDKVPVDYTARKNIRFIPGSKSQVTFRNALSITVAPVNFS